MVNVGTQSVLDAMSNAIMSFGTQRMAILRIWVWKKRWVWGVVHNSWISSHIQGQRNAGVRMDFIKSMGAPLKNVDDA
jgi:hypothetical protein